MARTSRQAPSRPDPRGIAERTQESFRSKLGISLVCLLFAVCFGAGGAVGFGGLVYGALGYVQSRSWEPVMVEVTEARLHSSRSRKSTTYRVEAEYNYDVGGKRYTGNRVGFGGEMSDNIGSWHEDRFHELDAARREGRRVLAWHDPKDPSRAVIDRDLRWGKMLFFVPFAVLFSAVSLGAMWALVQVWRK